MGFMSDVQSINQFDATKYAEVQALTLLAGSTYSHVDKAKVQARLDKLLKKLGVYK